jgi:uncharacterized protein involved in outer membrane biogenesis
MKKAWGITLTVVAGVVFLGVAIITLGATLGPLWARDWFVKKTGFGLTFDKLEVNPWASSLEIKNLKLTNPSSFKNSDFISLPSAKLAVDLSSLGSPKIHFREIGIDWESLAIVKRADGVTNSELLAQTFKGKEQTPKEDATSTRASEQPSAAQKDISIDKLSIKFGKFITVDETYDVAKSKTTSLNLALERKNIGSLAEFKADLTAAALPALLHSAGVNVDAISGVTGTTLQGLKTGASATTMQVEKVSGKAAHGLKNLIKALK